MSKFIVLIFFVSFRGETSCFHWLGHAVSSSKNKIFYTQTDLTQLAKRSLFEDSGKIKFESFKRYIKSLPPVIIDPHLKKLVLQLIEAYRYSSQINIHPFDPAQTVKFYGIKKPTYLDALNYFRNQIVKLQSDLASSQTHRPRRVVSFVSRYRWVIMGATIFALWDPINAEIRSIVYWTYNNITDLIFDKKEVPSTPIDQLKASIKNDLRGLYFTTNDNYPTTMQMSRNNFNYLSDFLLKRRADLSVAQTHGDEGAIRWNLYSIYLLPYLYEDIFNGPFSVYLWDLYKETINIYDQDGLFLNEFRLEYFAD